MLDLFLHVGLPYLAIIVCAIGTLYRFRSKRFSISSMSSQFLESKKLRWGSAPWHMGILVLFLGHLVVFLAPGWWHDLMAVPAFLMIAEVVGMAAAILCVLGLMVLIYRRVTSDRLQRVSNAADLLVLALLLVQVALGLGTAVSYRWGAAWATGTLAPYVWSLITLRPDLPLVADMPWLIKAHLVGAWLVLLAIPFSRLVHMFSIPIEYLARAPQRVIWNNPRRTEHAVAAGTRMESRRYFLRGALGLTAAGALLSIGVVDKLFKFFQMPGLHVDEEAAILEARLKRLHLTAEEKQLELERMRSESIHVAKLSELGPSQGKYFIDYAMRPALAFLGADGYPLLLSAKCTHLGCTVGNQVDAQGRILCPCHVSFFDVKTGTPNPDAPAKAPLARIGWIVRDDQGREVASETPRGTRTGRIDPTLTDRCSVFIVKRLTPEV